MILFEKDWDRYPTAIADTKTKNESFIRISRLYKSMGIKNHLFPLALLQPQLQGVDPHSSSLTLQQRSMIALEVKFNIWYFLREVVRIPAKGSSTPKIYLANRGNIAVTWLHMCNIDVANIQIRQTGKSVSTDCINEWNIDFGAENTLITLITKDDTLRRENVRRLKEIRSLLPKYLVMQTRDDADNQIEITNKTLNNHYKTAVQQNNEISANNLGRGLTTPIAHFDESPFINLIGITLPAALAAGTAARIEAELAGAPYGNIFTTTAGKKDDRDGKYMYEMIHGGAEWNEIFFEATDKKHLRTLVEKGSSGLKPLVNVTMNHRQLGYTDEWLYRAIADANSTGEAADRDFFNIWTSGTQSSPLSAELNQRIRASEMDVMHSEFSKDGYTTRWYVNKDELETYIHDYDFILSLDTSEAIGRDAITLVLTNLSDLSNTMVATVNETNTVVFSYFVAEFLIKYPRVTLLPERKSTGISIIDGVALQLMAAGIDPFRRIFNRIVDEADENKNAYAEICKPLATRHRNFYDERKGKFGFVTTGSSRDTLYSTCLQEAAKKAGHMVRDRKLIEEITGLVVKNGRIDHKASGHDDHVIAWILNHWFVLFARNIHHYGIDPLSVMRHVGKEGKALSEDDVEERHREQEVLEKIEDLSERLRTATNEFEILKLEHQIKALSNSIRRNNDYVGDTVAAMIAQLEEERQELYRNKSNERQQFSSSRGYTPTYHFRTNNNTIPVVQQW